ncbi:MAG: FHA domain-containing protein [Myxococcota bacterium]
MTDQNRKTLRSFYCRDYLWELFEQMTHELGCSMDYLINESMRLYARSRDFPADEHLHHPGGPAQGGGAFGSTPADPSGAPAAPMDRFHVGYGPSNGMEHRTFERMPSVGQPAQRPAPPQPGGFNQSAPMPPQPPRPGGAAGWQQPSQPQNGGFGQTAGFGEQDQHAPLYLIFNNNRYPVDKDKFVIGRGSQQTDLTIRDPNISRKHCAVIFHNGAYYIKDLGSTNGIEYHGNRIESKKIDDGDVFYLCDYELRFSSR